MKEIADAGKKISASVALLDAICRKSTPSTEILRHARRYSSVGVLLGITKVSVYNRTDMDCRWRNNVRLTQHDGSCG